MENKDIIEGNKAIEIFVGNEVIKNTVIHKSGQRTHISESNYHKDWNMLMEVVEKIESLGYFTLITTSNIGYKHYMNIVTGVWITKETTNNPSELMGVSDSKIEAVYKAVLQFITWYNSNK